jgi:hypothetical protein
MQGTMFRALSVLAGSVAAAAALAQQPAPLAGSLDAGVYTSPTGAFKMEVPVLPELGGAVHDTDNAVIFRDNYGTLVTVAAFKHDASQRWELSTRGIKDYVIYFFKTFVYEDFRHLFPTAQLQSAGFSADYMDGSLFTYVLLPGGSMFASPDPFGTTSQPPVAKRGNLTFVRNGFTFVVSTELSERVTEGSRYNKTTEQENQILRSRLIDIVRKIQFAKPAQQPGPAPTQTP